MGLESEPVRVRASGAPIRCPYCHADVLREEEEWVACDGCLARHHAACWSEGKGCAGCGETRFLSREQALSGPSGGAQRPERAAPLPMIADDEVPSIELELRGEKALVEGHDQLALVARPGLKTEAAELVLTNRTSRAQTVELRHVPAWARVEGPATLEIAAGATTRVRLTILVEAAPFETVAASADRGMTRGMKNPIPDLVRGTFIVVTGDDSRAISLEVHRALPDSALLSHAIVLGMAFHVGLIFALIYASRGKRPARLPGESVANHLLKVRFAEGNARLARLMGRVLCVTIPIAVVSILFCIWTNTRTR